MLDLWFGLAILLLGSAGAFWISARVPRSSSKRRGELLLLGTMLATGLYAIYLRDSTLLVRVLPLSNLIVLGNCYPIAAGAIGGLAWRHSSGRFVRRAWPAAALGVVGAFAAVQPLLGTAPVCGDRWDEQGICRQTTPYTCTPACAATVLASHGIPATEQEMAELCLTRRGTTWRGLYRA